MPETSPGDVGLRTAAPGSSEGNEQDKRPERGVLLFNYRNSKVMGKSWKKAEEGESALSTEKRRIVVDVSTDAARGEENGVKYLKCWMKIFKKQPTI